MRDSRSHCLGLAALALASGVVGASAAAVPTVLPFPVTGIFFVLVILVGGAYLLQVSRTRVPDVSALPSSNEPQRHALLESRSRLQEELAVQQQETVRLMEDKTLLQFLKADLEQERQRIAQDLHDHLLQDLTAILMQWETMAEKPQIQGETLLSGIAALREMVRQGRRIMNRLSPPGVPDEGVVASLQRLTDPREGSSLTATFQADVEFDRLTPILECALVRLARETLDHAQVERAAREATVELTEAESRLFLKIQAFSCDEAPSPADSALLVRLNEAARLIKGHVTLESSLDAVQMRLDVPINDLGHTLGKTGANCGNGP